MNLHAGDALFEFSVVPLAFRETGIADVFARKNNKTVSQTVAHRRYIHLTDRVHDDYSDSVHEPIGTFLLQLKASQDQFYLNFLNKYGDQTYGRFLIESFLAKKGVYAWSVNGVLSYIGRSRDPFGKRVNQGYGRISPKNCFLDGQSTNCHLNALIAESIQDVSFAVCPIEDDQLLIGAERELIQRYQPQWNTALKAR